MNPLASVDRAFRAPAPARRLGTVRLLVGAFACAYLVARANVLVGFAHFDHARFEPVGLAAALSSPLPEWVVSALWAVSLPVGVAFALGYRFAISGPLFELLFLWVTSYRDSWGMVFHTENLTAVHLCVLALCPAAHSLSLDARTQAPTATTATAYGWPLHLLNAVTVTAYLIAGLAKWRNSGWDWVEGEVLRNYIAYDCVRKEQVGSLYSPLGAWAVQFAWPFPLIGAATMVLELGAPLALLNARLGRAWAYGMYAFHVGVLLTMAIAFPYPLCGIAFAPFFAVERVLALPGLRRLAGWLAPGEELGMVRR